jgi:hypothetical protein
VKIKKVEDKPVVLHTKEETRLKLKKETDG